MSFLGINFAPKQSRVELHKFGGEHDYIAFDEY